jgi:hypothetical protein
LRWGVEPRFAVLTFTIDRRLDALKSATQINRFQHLSFTPPSSIAIATGMVSNEITGFQIPESRHNLGSIERIELNDYGRSERPLLKSQRT